MSNVIRMEDYRDRRIPGPNGKTAPSHLSEAARQARVEHTRRSLINYLTKRRERLGMTALDVKQSPEQVAANELEMKLAQQKMMDDYLQSRESVDTM